MSAPRLATMGPLAPPARRIEDFRFRDFTILNVSFGFLFDCAFRAHFESARAGLAAITEHHTARRANPKEGQGLHASRVCRARDTAGIRRRQGWPVGGQPEQRSV